MLKRFQNAWNALVADDSYNPVSERIESVRRKHDDEKAEIQARLVTPETPEDIELGQYVYDNAAGLRGYVVCKRETISGMVQYAIQRPTPSGFSTLIPEFSDWNNLQVDPEIDVLVVSEPANPNRIQFGDHCKDAITGQEGVATEKHTHINGCVTIQMEYRDKEGERRGFTIHANRLEVQADKEQVKLPAVPVETPRGAGGFGGPMTRL